MGFSRQTSASSAWPGVSRVVRQFLCLAVPALVALGMAAHASAQTPPVPTKAGKVASAPAATVAPQIEGKTIAGLPFKLSSLKGKVVLVLYWSTSCAVCRDKMPELRTNYEGWAGKPFELVAVSTDKRMQELVEYERIIARTVPTKQRFVQLWTGDASYRDNLGEHAHLPAGYLIDKSGKVVERYTGRIPAQAWDRIADLL